MKYHSSHGPIYYFLCNILQFYVHIVILTIVCNRQLTGDIHEEVENHNRVLDHMVLSRYIMLTFDIALFLFLRYIMLTFDKAILLFLNHASFSTSDLACHLFSTSLTLMSHLHSRTCA